MTLTRLVQHLAEALVDHTAAVEVSARAEGTATVIELRVHPDDRGKIIGRRGQTARALRTVVAAANTRSPQRVVLNILED